MYSLLSSPTVLQVGSPPQLPSVHLSPSLPTYPLNALCLLFEQRGGLLELPYIQGKKVSHVHVLALCSDEGHSGRRPADVPAAQSQPLQTLSAVFVKKERRCPPHLLPKLLKGPTRGDDRDSFPGSHAPPAQGRCSPFHLSLNHSRKCRCSVCSCPSRQAPSPPVPPTHREPGKGICNALFKEDLKEFLAVFSTSCHYLPLFGYFSFLLLVFFSLEEKSDGC